MSGEGVGRSIARGAGVIKDKIFGGSDYGKYIRKIRDVYSFLGNHVKNIALLDPDGFGSQKNVRVPMVVAQVVDNNQKCEFLPPECFRKGKMRVDKGQLFVKGMAYPIMPVSGVGVERAVTHDSKQLYAINTNHQDEALKNLGLDPSKYKNKRLVIACDGGRVIPPPAVKDLRLMRAVYNAEFAPETRRIKNETTGATMWPLTLLVAIPLNLCSGIINVALMVPHSICNGVGKFFNYVASNFEGKARDLSVINSRGTVVGATSAVPYVLIGAVFRCCERIVTALTHVIGGVRSASTCAVRSVPTFVSAAYNGSVAELKVGARYLANTASSIGSSFVNYGSDTVSYGKFYANMGSQDVGLLSSRNTPNNEDNVKLRDVDNTHVQHPRSTNIARGIGSGDARAGEEGVRETISLGKDDLLQVRTEGKDLSSLGVTIGYGTAEQVRENFASSVGVTGVAIGR